AAPRALPPLERRPLLGADQAAVALRRGPRRLAAVGAHGRGRRPEARRVQFRLLAGGRGRDVPAAPAPRIPAGARLDRAHPERAQRILRGGPRLPGPRHPRPGRPAGVLLTMIPGVALAADDEALLVVAESELHVVSSATVGGGVTAARSIINLHVAKDFAHETLAGRLSALAHRRGVPAPWVGLATAAWTSKAQIASAPGTGTPRTARGRPRGSTRGAAVRVGPPTPVRPGTTPLAPAPLASTINTTVLVDATAETPALVNAVITATEVKTSVLLAAG